MSVDKYAEFIQDGEYLRWDGSFEVSAGPSINTRRWSWRIMNRSAFDLYRMHGSGARSLLEAIETAEAMLPHIKKVLKERNE